MAVGAAGGQHGPVRVVVAPDTFRGSVRSVELAHAVADAVRGAGHDADAVPLADGGEGFLDALGGPNRQTVVPGPLGDLVTAPWRYSGPTAVVEMARASGLELLGGRENNDPMAASTMGTGELIAAAIDAGCRRIVIGVGGSATTDGGLGAIRALEPVGRLRGISMIVACDVRTTFVDAAEAFAPQKGATPAQVELLRRRLERLAQVYEETYGVDVRNIAGGGAAGGLAGGLAAVGARLIAGFDLVADELDLLERLEGADLVVTGEGLLDAQSFAGKVIGGVADLAVSIGVPVLAVVGEVDADVVVPEGVEVVSLVERFGLEEAWTDPAGRVIEVVLAWLGRASAVS